MNQNKPKKFPLSLNFVFLLDLCFKEWKIWKSHVNYGSHNIFFYTIYKNYAVICKKKTNKNITKKQMSFSSLEPILIIEKCYMSILRR